MKYKLKHDEDDEIIPCECCDGTVPIKDFDGKKLCFICSNSVGNSHDQVSKAMMVQIMRAFHSEKYD